MDRKKAIRKKAGYLLALCGTAALLVGCGKGSKAYEKAVVQAESGNYEEAAQSFQNAIHENSERAEYYIGYGMVLNRLNRFEEAIEQFELAYQDTVNSISNQNNKQIYFGEAVAYYNLGEYEKSISFCDQAMELEKPKELDTNILGTRAASSQMLGNLEKALEAYNKIIKQDKDAWGIYIKRAGLQEELEDFGSAKDDYLYVINHAEKKYDAYFGLYELYISQDEKEDATQVMNQLLSLKTENAQDICQLGKAYYYLKEYENAAAYLEEAREGGSTEANYYLGLVAMAQKDYERAVNCFNAYLEVHTIQDVSMAYNQLAGCFIETKEYEKAEEYLASGLEKSNMESRQALLKNQVILYEKLGKFRLARKAAKDYLASSPEDTRMQKELEFIKTRIRKKANKKSGDPDVTSDTAIPATGAGVVPEE